MRLLTTLNGMAAGLAATLLSGAAYAQNLEIIGQPVPKAMGFQPDGTELARDLHGLDHLILYIITAIVIFVTALLVYAIIRFRKGANPTPARFSHYTPIEIVWTLVPILILIVIGSFSLPVLFKQQEIPVADVTIKVTGNQWYWSYEYVDDGVAFDSYMIGSPATGGTNQMTPDVEKQLVDAGYSKEQFLLATDTAPAMTSVLRAFELVLLRDIGLLPALDQQTLTLQPLQAEQVYELSAEGGLRQVTRVQDEPAGVATRGVVTGQTWSDLHTALDSHAPWMNTLRVCAHLSTEDRSALQTQLRALLHHHCGVAALRTRQLMVELQSL